MNHIDYFLSIIGTTSTGKSEFAFQLAETLITIKKTKGVAILSADSRQVYKDLEILSGADVPEKFFQVDKEPGLTYAYYQSETQPISLHGQNMLRANEEWSVAQFKVLAAEIANWCESKGYLLLVVGGTGLYHAQLNNDAEELFVPPQPELRQKAAEMSVDELQLWLAKKNKNSLDSMNNSDKNNPRRLVRALEKSFFSGVHVETKNSKMPGTHLTIGLQKDFDKVVASIEARIGKRMKMGALQEVELCSTTYSDHNKAVSTLGFTQLLQLIQGTIEKEQAIELWKKKELQYAKRQLTWWKKHTPNLWLDADSDRKIAQTIDLIEQSI